MNAADIHTLAAPYALNALSDEEERSFEAHLAACDACQQEVAEFRETAAALGAAASEPSPPDLRARVLAEIDVTRQEAPLLPPPRQESRGARLRSVAMSVAAAAVIVIIGLTTVVARLDSRIERLEARSAEVYSVLAAEDTRRVSVEGAGGRIEVIASPSQDRALVIGHELPTIADDQVLELWIIDDGTARPAGLFRPTDSDRSVELMAFDLSGAEMLAVTIEPEGGSLQPTSEPIMAGEI